MPLSIGLMTYSMVTVAMSSIAPTPVVVISRVVASTVEAHSNTPLVAFDRLGDQATTATVVQCMDN